MKMKKFSVRLGLRSQIAALGVGGVILLGGIYLAGNAVQSRLQSAADESSPLARLTSDLAADVLEGRRIEMEFLDRPVVERILTRVRAA